MKVCYHLAPILKYMALAAVSCYSLGSSSTVLSGAVDVASTVGARRTLLEEF